MRLLKWFDNSVADESKPPEPGRIDWPRVIPFILLHLTCLFALVTGVSPIAIIVCIAAYLLRMFAITAFYHRYFSHKAFKTSRVVEAIFGFIGASATQRGPLWWAAHHRTHHASADTPEDPHSPRDGFWRSHMFWFLKTENFPTHTKRIPDLARNPVLRAIDRFDILPPILFAVMILLVGIYIETQHPELGASRWQILIWGFFVSTVLLSHVTFCINSIAHRFGSRRYETDDDSRNNFLLAILTLGEGWHNNHHQHPAAARAGIAWWEIDVTWYILALFEKLGLIWDLRPRQDRVQTS